MTETFLHKGRVALPRLVPEGLPQVVTASKELPQVVAASKELHRLVQIRMVVQCLGTSRNHRTISPYCLVSPRHHVDHHH
mmetsp:Transcript_16108/g.28545  ORF Transcript_16108/g.28545 Transcript_16108/m.28545 type:complete len:80 (-) Transcript_16108:307-546(-)